MKNALIAAIVSAVVAAATAGAAVTVVITSKDIKNGTIQTIDISAKAKKALKGNKGATGARGATGAAGPPAGVQAIQEVISAPVSVLPDQTGQATATCPAGRTAISGGFIFAGIVGGSFTNDPGTGWVAVGFNDLTTATDIRAVAYCAANVAFTPAPLQRAATESALDARASSS
jgi:hypothetical protein